MPGNASFMSGSHAGRPDYRPEWPDYGPGLRGMIWGLRGLILSSRDQISGPSRLDEGLRPLKGGDGRKDGRTDGRMEIHPCVLQDIGPLGPLPCSHPTSSLDHYQQGIGYR